MAKLASLYSEHEKLQRKFTGRAFANLKFQSEGSAIAGVIGKGEMEIIDGDLWDSPILSGIAGRTKVTPAATTVSQAAATFHLDGKQVRIDNAACWLAGSGRSGRGHRWI
jgi:hypothetical protein